MCAADIIGGALLSARADGMPQIYAKQALQGIAKRRKICYNKCWNFFRPKGRAYHNIAKGDEF